MINRGISTSSGQVCYRKERERVEYLFALYRKLTEGFGAEEEGKKKKGRT